ncbi:hypothetical protein PsYK624_053410 [Phanerochaete sordida]|uniref:Uncharacterized protein n=1 Tax=Phanerochaete sordida TaxID=48140 RepID=A0A9P3LBI8_9APHY|nr:hypothetical protein PsYK624_053410 [Phanerochaete sordida]
MEHWHCGYHYDAAADRLAHPEAFDYTVEEIHLPLPAQFYQGERAIVWYGTKWVDGTVLDNGERDQHGTLEYRVRLVVSDGLVVRKCFNPTKSGHMKKYVRDVEVELRCRRQWHVVRPRGAVPYALDGEWPREWGPCPGSEE